MQHAKHSVMTYLVHFIGSGNMPVIGTHNIQHDKSQHNTAQHNAAQHDTPQDNATQHNTAQQRRRTCSMPFPVVLAASWTSGRIMNCSASTREEVSSLSMGMGFGPTPIRQQAAPQKGWSPKKGTTVVGQPAIKPAQCVQLPCSSIQCVQHCVYYNSQSSAH